MSTRSPSPRWSGLLLAVLMTGTASLIEAQPQAPLRGGQSPGPRFLISTLVSDGTPEPVETIVVGGVHDDGDLAGIDDPDQSPQEAGSPDASGERDDHARERRDSAAVASNVQDRCASAEPPHGPRPTSGNTKAPSGEGALRAPP